MKKKFTFLMIVALVALLVAVTMVACNPKDAKFTVTFSLGDGVEGDAPAPIKAAENEQIVLPNVTREGFTFLGWSDGENTYAPGDSFTVVADVTLTATWHDNDAPIYTVTFSLGELEGIATPVQAIKAEANVPIVLPAATHTGYTFLSWSDGDDVYTAGSYYTATADVTLTANWRNDSLRTFTVTFSLGELADLAVAPQPQVVNDGATIHLPAAPVIAEYNFQYWELEGTISHYDEDDEYEVRANVTFVARYRDNGRVPQEWRGSWIVKGSDAWVASSIFNEAVMLTKDDIYYCGFKGTDYEVTQTGSIKFKVTYYFGEVEEMTPLILEVYEENDKLWLRSWGRADYDYSQSTGSKPPFAPDELERKTYSVTFYALPDIELGENNNVYSYYLQDDGTASEEDLAGVPTADEMEEGFVGWYSMRGANYPPEEEFDPEQKLYTYVTYYAKYCFYGTYRDEDDNFITLDGKYAFVNSAAGEEYNLDYETKTLFVGARRYKINWNTWTFEDISVDAEEFDGEWYGMFKDNTYYNFKFNGVGYGWIYLTVAGRPEDTGTSVQYTVAAINTIQFTFKGETYRIEINDDGTLTVSDNENEYVVVKKGTVVGTWTNSDKSNKLVFTADTVSVNGETAVAYEKQGSTYLATYNDEQLTITVNEVGVLSVASSSDSSEIADDYMPGENGFVPPVLGVKDKFEGVWYGVYGITTDYEGDEYTVYIVVTLDGWGNVSVKNYSVYVFGEQEYVENESGGTNHYQLTDDDHITWVMTGMYTLWGGEFAANGTLIFDHEASDRSKNLVLVKVGEIEANWVNESNTKAFVFNDGQVTFGDYTAPYVKGDGNWTATLNNENLTFTITEYGKLVVTSDNPDSEFAGNDFHPQKEVSLVAPEPPTPTIPAESEYYGTWEGSDSDGDYTLVIKSDKSGTIDYDAGYMSGEEPFDGSFTWTYDPATGKISFTGASFYGDEQYSCLISDGQMIMTVSGSDITLTKTADEGSKEQVDDSAQAFYGTWEGSDGDGDFTLVIKSDKSGTIDYEPDYWDEEPFNGSFTWTYDPATGKISFTSASFYEDADYTCEISGGKLVMSYGSTSVTLTKTSGGTTGGDTSGGGQDVPPAKDHDDAWYHNALKGSWSGFEHTDEWTYYLEFDGEGNVTLSYADIGPHTVLETVAYTINEDGTITFHKTFSFKIVVVDETHITVTMDGETYNIEKLPEA